MKKYKAIIYDLDGTVLDTLKMNMIPLLKIIKEETGEDWSFEQVLKFASYPGMKVMEELQVKNPEETYARWVKYVNEYEDGATLYDGFKEVFEAFDGKIIQAVASSKKKKQYEIDFLSKGLGKYIVTAVLEEDTTKHKPDPEPILECLKRLNIKNEDAIYIGDTYSDYQTCKNAHVDFSLAKWGCTKEFETDSSCLIFNQPLDLLKLLDD